MTGRFRTIPSLGFRLNDGRELLETPSHHSYAITKDRQAGVYSRASSKLKYAYASSISQQFQVGIQMHLYDLSLNSSYIKVSNKQADKIAKSVILSEYYHTLG